jgi:hypothetical protein
LLPFVRYFWHDAKLVNLVRKVGKVRTSGKSLEFFLNKKDTVACVFKISFLSWLFTYCSPASQQLRPQYLNFSVVFQRLRLQQ